MRKILLFVPLFFAYIAHGQCPAPEIAPWLETFTTTTNPPCWTQSTTSGGPWVYTGTPDIGNTAVIVDHTSGVSNNYAWVDQSATDAGVILQGPIIDVTALTVPYLSFWIMSHNNNGTVTAFNQIHVEASDGLGGWVPVDVISGDFGFQWVEFGYGISGFTYGANLCQFRFRAESGGSASDFDNDMLLDDVGVNQAPSCPTPTSLVGSNGTTSSVELSWAENGSATSWLVEYGAPGFTPGTGTTVTAGTNISYLLSGLTASSFYDIYVRSFCAVGDTSLYAGPISINTYDVTPYTFMETDVNCPTAGFIDISGTGTGYDITDDGEQNITMSYPFIFQGTIVSDIRIGNNGGILFGVTTGDIATTGTVGGATANGVYPWWDDMDSETGDVFYEEIGVAPNRIAVIQWDNICNFSGSVGAPTVTFQVQIHETTNEIYYVYDDVIFGAPFAAEDFGGLASIGLAGPNQDFLISNDNMAFLMANSCVRFYYPTCPKPSNITSSYSTTDSIQVGWTSNGSETAWVIEYGPTGFTQGTGTLVATTTNPDTIGVLIDNTVYDFYVYADCGSGDTSFFAGPATFATDIVCPAPTGFALNYTGADSAGFIWTPQGVETSWIIEYGPTGFVPGTGSGTVYTTNTVPDTIVGLAPGTVYQFYIQADCGMGLNNPWTGPITYSTPIVNDSTCNAVAVPVDGSTTTYTNAGATQQVGTIVPGFNTVWFTFVAPASGNVEIATCGNDFNNMLAIYSATDCSNFGTFTLEDGATGNPFTTCAGVGSAGVNTCGLTPGNTYYLVIGSEVNGVTGLFPLTLTELPAVNAGSAIPTDVCEDNSDFDLFTTITGNETTSGTWYNPVASAGNEAPSLISVVGAPAGTYPFFYVQVEVCGSDTVETSITVIETPNVGMGGTIDAGCNYNPVSLADGLSGTIDFGGTWYTASGDALTSSLVTYNMDPAGSYVYHYVVDNGVCAPDSATVTVNIIDCLGISESHDLNLVVYPNPVVDVLTIQNLAIETGVIELLDVQGKVVSAVQVNGVYGNYALDMNNVQRGMYIVRITTETSVQEVRVVKH